MMNITRNKTLPLAGVCLAASLSLSSCYIYWNTGECIKDMAVSYTGVDISKPVGNVAYKGKDGAFYMQAPEVRYRQKHHLTGVELIRHGGYPDETYTGGVSYTGRNHWVKLKGKMKDGVLPIGRQSTEYVEKVPALPAGAKAVPCAPMDTSYELASYFNYPIAGEEKKRSKMSWLTTTVAAPLEYVVDPVLMVATNVGIAAVWGCAVIVFSPVAVPASIILIRQDQQEETLPDTPELKPRTEQE